MNLWEVAVLALLREAPMHPYEMQRLLRERHKAELLVLKRGSVYNAIGRLMRTGLIEAAGTGRSGRRPERTTYRITPEGRDEFLRELGEMVEHPRREASEFTAALSFLVHLAPDDAIAKLEERASRLDEEIRGTTATLKSVLARVGRINLIESEYDMTMRRAELKWVRGLIGELQSGSVRWDTKAILRRVSKIVCAVLTCVVVSHAAAAQSSPALKGKVERIKVHGTSLEGNLEGDSPDRDVSIYLPPSYLISPDRRYPVVYMLHGIADSDDRWFGLVPSFVNVPVSMEAALGNGSARDMILVMPNAFTRYQGSFYGSSGTTGDWETFATRDLVAYIDGHYRTLASRAGRGLAGHSMGGYGAIRLAMKHPEVYSAVYVMSACCLYQDTPALATVQKADAVQSPDDFQKADYPTRILMAEGAAWSGSAKPPRFFNLPFKDGELQPLVVAEWNANMPAAMLGQYAANLRTIRFLALDVGLQDFLLGGMQGMDQLLTSHSVPHSFETYEGTHTSRIGERLETKVFPFFTRNLSFGAVTPKRGH